MDAQMHKGLSTCWPRGGEEEMRALVWCLFIVCCRLAKQDISMTKYELFMNKK